MLSACGAGGGGGETAPVTAAAPNARVITGSVVKGPLRGAAVDLFAVNAFGNPAGSALCTATTGNDGSFSISGCPSQPLVARTRGGSYADESDTSSPASGRRQIALGPAEGFTSIILPGTNTLVITPYTAAMWRKAQIQANGINFVNIYNGVVAGSPNYFGLDPTTTIPADPAAPAAGASAAQKQYALLLGGAANAVNSIATQMGRVPDFAAVNALIEDLADGKLDGHQGGTPVQLGGQDTPSNVNLNNEIHRFGNNNNSSYGSVSEPQVNETAFSQPASPSGQAPAAANDSYSTPEDVTLNVAAANGVLANDTGVGGGSFAAVLVSAPASGTLTLNSNGSFSYVPLANFIGTVSFSYKASDGTSETNIATVSITINGNRAPIAVDDGPFSAFEDIPFTLTAPGVLANDSDPDGNTLTPTLVSSPPASQVISATLNANGSFSATPAPDFNGTATFQYKVNDGKLDSAVKTITVDFASVNDPPTAANDSATVIEDSGANPIDVLANDGFAPDLGETLTVAAVTQGANGVVTISSGATGLTYAPSANYVGPDSFTYIVSDGNGGSATASVSITVTGVNDAPVAGNDTAFTNEDAPLDINVLANDSDADLAGTPSVATHSVAITAQGGKGVASVNPDGSVHYAPNLNQNGQDNFSYKINDGSADSNPATVTVNINPVNDAPVANGDAYTTNEEVTLNSSSGPGICTGASPGLLCNDNDVEADALTAALVAQAANGTATVNADGSFSYRPNPTFFGTDSFTYKANDGKVDSAPATVTITVKEVVNIAPVAAADNGSTLEDAILDTPAPGVLGNDIDPDNKPVTPLTAVLVTSTANGLLNLRSDGSYTYTPNANFNGADSFTYKANDGKADSNVVTVSLTVTTVNDAPFFDPIADEAVPENVPAHAVSITGVSPGPADESGQALNFTAVSDNPSVVPNPGVAGSGTSRTLTYQPFAGANGVANITVTATDSGGTTNGGVNSFSRTFKITVSGVNDNPTATDDVATVAEDSGANLIDVLANDSIAPDTGETLSIVSVTPAANGAVAIIGGGSGLTYTPNANYVGADSFTYTISDGNGGSATATVSVTVSAVDDAPVAVDDSAATNEDTALGIATSTLLANDTDVDGPALSVTAVGNAVNGTVSLSGSTVTFTPTSNYNGPASFEYTVSDGTLSDTGLVNVSVAAVNDPPVAQNDSYSTNEDVALNVPAPGVLGNDSDVDAGTTLTASLVSAPASGSLTLNANGSFSYTPQANFNGSVTFTYRASDGSANSNIATVTLTIVPVNDAPVAADDAYSTNEDSALTVTPKGVLANDSDIDGDALTAVLEPATGPAKGTLTLNPDGSLSYTPNANFNGTDTFKYRASDGTLSSNLGVVTITVNSVPDAPKANDDAMTVAEGGSATMLDDFSSSLLANDTDGDGDTLSVTFNTTPAHGSVIVNSDGTFLYVHDGSESTSDSFTYTASDGFFNDTATVNITIAPANDAPVANADTYTAVQNTPLSVTDPGVLGNDTDAEGSVLSAALVTAPAHGTLSLNPSGGFIYTPASGYVGADSFTYKANDGAADSSPATVSITVNAGSATPSAALLPFVTAAGDLQLLDPSAALSASNPLTVDSGLSVSLLRSNGARTYVQGTISGTTVTNLRESRLIYLKGGQVFSVNLDTGQSHTPVRISSLSSVCRLDAENDDLTNADNSLMLLVNPGGDSTCNTGDDFSSFIHLNASTTDPGQSPAGLSRVEGLHNASGAIVDYLTKEGASPGLFSRDAGFANPVLLKALEPTAGTNYEARDNFPGNLVYLKLVLSGQTQSQLFRYDLGTRTLSAALYTFGSAPGVNDFQHNSTFDGTDFYFPDGNSAQRIPLSATNAGQVQQVTSLAAGQNITELGLPSGSNRLVISAVDAARNGGVYSVIKTDIANPSPVVLQANNPVSGVFAEAREATEGRVYIDVYNGTAISLLKVNADGSNPVTTPNGYIGCGAFPSTIDFAVTPNFDDATPAYMVLGIHGVDDSLQILDPLTGNATVALGTVASTAAPSSAVNFSVPVCAVNSFGRYALAQASIDRGGPTDNDVYFFDSQTGSSLQPLATTAGSDDIARFKD